MKRPMPRMKVTGANAEWLATWVPRVLRLNAWRVPGRVFRLREVVIRSGTSELSSGHAWPGAGRVVVTAGSNKANALAALVHEFAHIAGGHHHDKVWKDTYRLGVREMTGVLIRDNVNTHIKDIETAAFAPLVAEPPPALFDLFDTPALG